MSTRSRGVLRLLVGALLLPGGALIATAAVLVHDIWWGLPLGVISTLVSVRALPGGPARVGFSLGWAAGVGVFAIPRPAGGYLVAGDLSGYALLLTAFVLVVAALATLPPRSRGSAANEGSHRPLPTMTP